MGLFHSLNKWNLHFIKIYSITSWLWNLSLVCRTAIFQPFWFPAPSRLKVCLLFCCFCPLWPCSFCKKIYDSRILDSFSFLYLIKLPLQIELEVILLLIFIINWIKHFKDFESMLSLCQVFLLGWRNFSVLFSRFFKIISDSLKSDQFSVSQRIEIYVPTFSRNIWHFKRIFFLFFFIWVCNFYDLAL